MSGGMRVLGEVPFEGLQMPDIFLSYIGRDPALERFLPPRPASLAELLQASAERLAYTGCEPFRQELAALLREDAERQGAKAPVMEAIDRLSRPGTLAIVTGQQPGLFGGPLYTWHKVATALRLATELGRFDGSPDLVTIFWNHSDDHDWGEANHSFLVNSGLDLQRIRLGMPQTGRPLFDIPAGELLSAAISDARDLLPATEFREAELELLEPRSPQETLGTHLTRQLSAHFEEEGLLVLDSSLLGRGFREVLLGFHERAAELRGVLKTTVTELADFGLEVNLDPEGPFLFQIEPHGRRSPVPDGQVCPSGHLPSPGVLFRNLWQDRVLPVLAFVSGPGEISYLAAAGGLYASLGLPRPPIVPRASLTHVGRRLAGYLERWGLGLADLDQGPGNVETWIAEREGGRHEETEQGRLPEEALRELAAELRRRLRDLEAEVARVDRNLLLPLARLESRTRSELGKLAEKLARQRRNRAGTWRQHARRLCAELRPRGRFQERVLPALPFLVRAGPAFAKELVAVADPFAPAHLLVSE
ncbi:MAG: bacillithiol biosynthesis BshC [Planctomycetota bacterium]